MKTNNIIALFLFFSGIVVMAIGIGTANSCTPLMKALQNCTDPTWAWIVTFLLLVGSFVAYASGDEH